MSVLKSYILRGIDRLQRIVNAFGSHFNSIQFNSIHSFIQSSILLEIIVRDGTVFVDSTSLQWKRHCCHLFRSDNGSLYSFIYSFIHQTEI